MKDIKLVIGKCELIGAITAVKHIGNTNLSEVDISIATLDTEPIQLKDGKLTYESRPDTARITVTIPTDTIKDYLI